MKMLCTWLVLASIATVSTALAASDTIVIGQPNWGYAKVMTNVMKIVIEDNFGLKVEVVPGNHSVFFKAMDEGKGDVDIHPDVWLPNNKGVVEEYVNAKGTVALTGVTFDAHDGFCTTKSAREKYNLKSVYDLTRPEIVELTDTDGDGKGELWMGGPGWQSTKIHQVRARGYGFADLYTPVVSEEATELALIDKAVAGDKVIVWACYSPHYIFGKHDLVFLDEPSHDPEKWKIADLENDANWLENSTAATAFPPTNSQIAYSKRLENDAPAVAKLLGNMKFGTDLINEWSNAADADGRDPAEYAREWVSTHPALIKSWLGN